MSDPQPPRDHAAERAIMGAILCETSALGDAAQVLSVDDFDLPAHQAIFAACLEMQSASPPAAIDQVTLGASLKASGKLQAAGGVAYLAKLQAEVATAANVMAYVRLVKSASIKRKLIVACRDISAMAVEPSTETNELVDEAQRRVFAVSEQRQSGDLVHVRDALDKTFEVIDKIREKGGGISGLSTGFYDLDKMLTGFHPGELIILAARPGVGKTSLALNIAAHAATRSTVPVAIWSLEMPQEQISMRLLAAEARIDLRRIREGALSSANMERIGDASTKLFAAEMYIDDSADLSAFDIRTKARRLQNRVGQLGLVIVDYLQLMHGAKRAESRNLEVQEISRSLKALAKELHVPVLALSQLNRKVEERGKKARPMLSDLRESGAIEQDADVVMFIHKEVADPESSEAPTNDAEVIVAKQRNGPTGSISLAFYEESTRFENKARPA